MGEKLAPNSNLATWHVGRVSSTVNPKTADKLRVGSRDEAKAFASFRPLSFPVKLIILVSISGP